MSNESNIDRNRSRESMPIKGPSFSISRNSSFSVIVSFIALALLGCVLVPTLPVKLSPSETLPAIGVGFSMRGSSARTVESEVTSRLESALSRVSGVKYVDSRSSSGRGYITLELDRNADINVARFEAAMIIRQLWSSLPENVSYPYIDTRQVDINAARPFMSYTINAGQQPSEIMRYADENIRPKLSRIAGIAKVDLSGATPMEWQIVYDSHELANLGITSDHIRAAISSHYGSEYLRMAQLKNDSKNSWTRLAIASSGDPNELDLSKIIVAKHGDEIITLDKIAKVEHVEAAPTGYFRINGLNSIYLNITATEDANQVDLSNKVKKCLAEMSLPQGYMFNLSYDASENISTELDKIYFRTGLTVLILLVFVGLITLSWRYLLLITVSLAINMAIAVVAYYVFKVEIQLYSLAGITISLNLMIDNLIVMTEHITCRNNLKAFTAVLAATLTTIGALSVVFFLDERTMLSLKDFVIVVIVNLAVSLAVALLLVPALIDRMKVSKKPARSRRLKRLPVFLSRIYTRSVGFLCRHKKLTFCAFILAFGLPVFLIPENIKGDGKLAEFYNKTMGSTTYKDNIKPWVERCLGGTLRLFADKVSNGGYFNRGQQEPVVSINATLPNGATLSQMNTLMQKMEKFLAGEECVRQFQTSISGARRGSITVYFKPEYQRTGHPYRLKSDAIAKALTLGGGSWGVYGLEDMGFSNDVRENAGSYKVILRGYNYDELYEHADRLRDSLLTYKRIKEVLINSEFSYWKDDYTEFYLNIDKERLAIDSLSISDLYRAVAHEFGRNMSVGNIYTDNGSEMIKLSSDEKDKDVWSLMNTPMALGKRMIKLSDYSTIDRRQTPPDIVKKNQEYVLCLQYEYIGSSVQGNKLLTRTIENFNNSMPLGYQVEQGSYSWNFGKDSKPYALLGLIAAIIFFVSAILFNSLRQPIAIIFVIPVSFIGVFLTFYLFDLKFDQGGFAAFILLCGITVNAAIYIVNEYNSLCRSRRGVAARKLYIQAFRAKITAVLLTVLSTVLGFIPFLIGDVQEGFWFPLAAGTMGGLIMSMAAIMFLLPVIILPNINRRGKKNANKRKDFFGETNMLY